MPVESLDHTSKHYYIISPIRVYVSKSYFIQSGFFGSRCHIKYTSNSIVVRYLSIMHVYTRNVACLFVLVRCSKWRGVRGLRLTGCNSNTSPSDWSKVSSAASAAVTTIVDHKKETEKRESHGHEA